MNDAPFARSDALPPLGAAAAGGFARAMMLQRRDDDVVVECDQFVTPVDAVYGRRRRGGRRTPCGSDRSYTVRDTGDAEPRRVLRFEEPRVDESERLGAQRAVVRLD